MKEASGELSMTLVTIIAVGVIVGIFALFWPNIQNAINNRWGKFEDEAGKAMIVRSLDLKDLDL